MRNLTKIILLVAVAVSAACQRQELENKLYVNALIPIYIDWANSGLDLEATDGDSRSWDLYSASVWLFPTSESKYQGAPLEYVLSNTGTKSFTKSDPVMTDFIEVPVGIYKMIVFNRSVDEFNLSADNVGFNTGSFETFEYYALENEDSKSLFSSTKADTGTTHQQPEALASWSYGADGETFEVTVDMVYMYDEVEAIKNEIYGTTSESKSSAETRASFDSLDPRLTTFVTAEDVAPTAVTREVTLQQHVGNIYNVYLAQCKFEGMARSVLLGGQTSGSTSTSHVVSYYFGYTDTDAGSTTNSTTDTDGYMKATLTTFMPRATNVNDGVPTSIETVQFKNIYYLRGTYLPDGMEDIEDNYTYYYSPKDDSGDDAYMDITTPVLNAEVAALSSLNSRATLNTYDIIIVGGDAEGAITDTVDNEIPQIEVGGGGFDVDVDSWDDDETNVTLGDPR